MSKIHTNCNHYDGDVDCNKCSIKGYIFSCAGCDIYREENHITECEVCGMEISKNAVKCPYCWAKVMPTQDKM